MIKLSERMNAVASLVTKGSILCDVGTDHGYVPIALIENNCVQRAIAVDINRGPIERAKEHIKGCGLEDKIETRLSDGLAAVEPGEVSSIIIAGMGGELVIHILSEGEDVCKASQEMILQPQSDIWKVRQYIRNNGYEIVEENMVYEDDKFYPMMKVKKANDTFELKKQDEKLTMVYDTYGPKLIQNKNEVLKKYLEKEHKKLTDILSRLMKNNSSDKIAGRIEQLKTEICYNELAYSLVKD